MQEIWRTIVSRAIACLSVVVLLVLAGPAQAGANTRFSDEATNSAFNALLSFPQGLPDDTAWNVQAPKDFEPTGQDQLIAWLAEQQKQGADFNAYQHFGTLLHHALRAGLDDTAVWLLQHGARPELEVKGDAESANAGNALYLAIYYRRWPVVDALMRGPGALRLTNEQLPAYWAGVNPGTGSGDADANQAVDQLLQRKFPLPSGRAGACLLGFALKGPLLGLVMALPQRTPLQLSEAQYKALPAAEQQWASLCTESASAPWRPAIALSALKTSDIERSDAKLDQALFPYLLASLATPEDAKRLFTVKIRRPFDHADFAQDVVQRAAWPGLNPQARMALLQSIPPEPLRVALKNPQTRSALMAAFATHRTPDFTWLLERIGKSGLNAHAAAALEGMIQGITAPAPPNMPDYAAVVAANWNVLLSQLDTLPTLASPKPLLQYVPMPAWPALMARGYKPGSDELNQWLANSTPQQLEQTWSVLKPHVPKNASQWSVNAILSPYASECPWEQGINDNALHKVEFLAGADKLVAKPLKVSASCQRRTPPEVFDKLFRMGAIQRATPLGKPRLEVVKLRCNDAPDRAIRAALTSNHLPAPYAEAGEVDIETIQAIDYPGDANCAYIVSGGHVSARAYLEEESFFDGYRRLTPCGDPTFSAEVWRMVGGKLQALALAEGAVEGGVQLRDASTGKRYFLSWPIGGSTCSGGHPAVLFGWVEDNHTLQLQALTTTDAVHEALEASCDLRDPGPCMGLGSNEERDATPDPAAGSPKAWDASQSPAEFINNHWATEREGFLQALLALDLPQLKAARAQGIEPQWVLLALDKVSASDLPLPDKRQRTAWLFRDAAGLGKAFGQSSDGHELKALAVWLPREDWRPVVNAFKDKVGLNVLFDDLCKAAPNQRKNDVLGVLSRALGRSCARQG